MISIPDPVVCCNTAHQTMDRDETESRWVTPGMGSPSATAGSTRS